MKTPLRSFHHPRANHVLPKWRAALVVTAGLGWLTAACHAQEIAVDPGVASPLPSAPWSPEGRQVLAVTLTLFVALILMERLCAWRLRIQQRRARTASQALLKALPSSSLALSIAPHRSGEGLRVRLLIVLVALGAFQLTGPALAAQTVYVANADNSNVGAYDAATGNPVAGFAPPTGLSGPGNVAVAGNTLYVAAASGLYAYNATTGAPLAGFNAPASAYDLQGLTVVGNTLYVSSLNTDDVRAYDATTGALLPGFLISGGIHEPTDIAVTGNVLYLARGGDGLIGTYNATTGAPIDAGFISLVSAQRFPFGLALSGNTLYVSDFNGSTISEYNASTGTLINGSFISGLQRPAGLTLLGNTLYIANSAGNTVGAYDALTGAPVAGFTSPAGLDNPFGVAVAGVPEPGPCVLLALCAVAGAVWRGRRPAEQARA